MKKAIKLAVAGAVMISAAVAAYAIPMSWSNIDYYSDASMTEVVGGRSMTCNGSRSSWGTSTPYMSIESGACDRNPVPCSDVEDPKPGSICANL